MIGWDRGMGWDRGDDEACWARDLHGTRLRVKEDLSEHGEPTNADEDGEGPDKADLTLLPWVWRVARVVDRFTEIELDSGRQATFDEAVAAAEDTAGDWR